MTMISQTFTMPAIDTHRYDNGLTLTWSHLPSVPMVRAHLAIPVELSDGFELAAVDVITATWPLMEEARRLEARGGNVAVSRRRQWLILTATGHSDSLAELLAVLEAAVSRYPGVSHSEAARRCRNQGELAAAQPAVDSAAKLWRQVYGEVPPMLSTTEAGPLDALTSGLAQAAQERLIDPAHAHLVVVGDFEETDLRQQLDRTLAEWSRPTPAPTVTTPCPKGLPTVTRVTRAGLPTSHIRLAAESLPLTDEWAFTTASVAALMLGGNFSSLLNELLRESHGLAYRTMATLNDHADRVMLVVEADVSTEHTNTALDLMSDLFADLGRRGPDQDRLHAAVGYTIGNHELALGSQRGRAACLLSYLTTGLGLERIEQTPERLSRITQDEVRAVFRLFAPDRWWGTIIGSGAEKTTMSGDFNHV